MKKRYHIILNQTAGRGNAAKIWKDRLLPVLREEKISYELYLSERPGHCKQLAKELSELPDEVVYLIVVGGDGTCNEVVNGITDFKKVQVGFVSTGSGNDLGYGLSMPKKPEDSLRKILKTTEAKSIDAGCVTYSNQVSDAVIRRFVISTGAGIDAKVCRDVAEGTLKEKLNRIKLGKLTYGICTLKQLVVHPMTSAKAVWTVDGKEIKEDVKHSFFFVGMNFPYEGGHIPMAPGADMTDGKLSVCMIHGLSRLRTLGYFLLLLQGKHQGINGFKRVECEKVTFSFEKAYEVHTDGEPLGEFTEVTFESIPGLLQVLC